MERQIPTSRALRLTLPTLQEHQQMAKDTNGKLS